MKIYFLLFLNIVITSLTVFSQQIRVMEDPEYISPAKINDGAIITGKIYNIPDSLNGGIELNYTPVTPFPFLNIQQRAQVNTDGEFVIKVGIYAPYIQIFMSLENIGRLSVLVSTDLHIDLDLSKVESDKFKTIIKGAKYSGKDGTLTGFYINYFHFLNINPRHHQNTKTLKFTGSNARSSDGVANNSIWYDSIMNVFFKNSPEFIQYEWLAKKLMQTRKCTELLKNSIITKEKITDISTLKQIDSFSPSFFEYTDINFYATLRRYLSIVSNSGQPIKFSMKDYTPVLLNHYKNMPGGLRDSLLLYLKSDANSEQTRILAKKIAPSVHKYYSADIQSLTFNELIEKATQIYTKPRSELVILQYCPQDNNTAKVFFSYYRNKFTTPWLCKEIDSFLTN